MQLVAERTAPLPLIPASLLKRHHVLEAHDNRFRSCARLLQALWRERQGLPMGTLPPRAGRRRKLGSLIAGTAANEGRNFLDPRIALLARTERAFQEHGAFIEPGRLFGNLLSSASLQFNLFGPMRFDFGLTKQVFRTCAPHIAIKAIRAVWFEHSPGRRDPTFTGDRTAFDVAIIFERPDGALGFIGIELKYSEACQDPAPMPATARYDELAEASRLYNEPRHALLRVNPLQQLYREHLLAYSALASGRYAEAHFLLVAPSLNYAVENAAQLYSRFLAANASAVPFKAIELERFISAYAAAGEEDHAGALHERYCDWAQIDALVCAELAGPSHRWSSDQAAAQPALIGQG